MKTAPVNALPDPWPDSRPLPWLIDLAEWLRLSGHYGAPERSRILTSLLDHGTLAHAVESGVLDPEDHAIVEAIFVSTQPPIDYSDPAWDCGDTWTTGPAIPPGAVLAPPEDPEGERPDWRNWRDHVQSGDIRPISGGSPADTTSCLERCAELLEKIVALQAQLDAVPADWEECYYPF